MRDAQHTTYDEYIESEKYYRDLNDGIPDQGFDEQIQSGYVYLDGFYILEHYDDMRRRSEYIVIIGNTSESFDDLGEAQEYLWNEWIDGEIN